MAWHSARGSIARCGGDGLYAASCLDRPDDSRAMGRDNWERQHAQQPGRIDRGRLVKNRHEPRDCLDHKFFPVRGCEGTAAAAAPMKGPERAPGEESQTNG